MTKARQVIFYSNNDNLVAGESVVIHSNKRGIGEFQLIPIASALHKAWIDKIQDYSNKGDFIVHWAQYDDLAPETMEQLPFKGTVIHRDDIRPDAIKIVLGYNSMLLVLPLS